MERIGRPLKAELERLVPAEADVLEIVRAWPAVVGETVARNAWPARLRRDAALVVHASSATWAFELGRMADEVLDRLRAAVGEAAPRSLQFVPGPLPEPPLDRPSDGAGTAVDVTCGDVAEGAALASVVDDEELRMLVARAAAASLARARAASGSDRGF